MLKSFLYQSTLRFDSAVGHLPKIGCFRPVRGAFSAWEDLQSGKSDGATISARQSVGPCPVASITERAGMLQNDHQPWPIFWVSSDDARLVGAMLHWRDPQDRLCREGMFNLLHRRRLREDRFFAQILVAKAAPLSGGWTSITSPWCDGKNYYHWMLDGLTRLLARDALPEAAGILLPRGLPKFAEETIDLLGLRGKTLVAGSDCIRPERYYFCSPTAMTGVWNPVGYRWLREAFASCFSKAGSMPPVFLTRRGRERIPENLQAIENAFIKHGYEVIDCGAITVSEQIAKISGAPAVAGLHGAAMTNILWARPGTPVLEIFQPQYLNACYEQIAFQGQLDYTHLVLEGENPLRTIEEWLDRQR